jgi:hypothetical protein
MLENLYHKLVIFTRECLSFDQNVYLGGVRRISKEQHKEFAEYLVDQNARAFAKRCLQISGVSLRNLAPELRPWLRILRRVKLRVGIEEAKDRSLIKANLIAALKTVYGIDPVTPGLENLAKAFSFEKARAQSTPSDTAPHDHKRWAALKYILQRDLDLEVPPEREDFFRSYHDLEPQISEIQTLLESSGQTANVTLVEPCGPDSLHVYKDLWNRYCPRYAPVGSRQASLSDPSNPVFIVRNLGAPVGFLQASRISSDHHPHSLRVDHLYCLDYMQKSGMSRRLIRSAIDFAHEQGCNQVWVSVRIQREDVLDKFRRCGFVDAEESVIYNLDRLTQPAGDPSTSS